MADETKAMPPLRITAWGEGWEKTEYMRADAFVSVVEKLTDANKRIAELENALYGRDAETHMPERIYALEDIAGENYWFSAPGDLTTEYIRADLVAKMVSGRREWEKTEYIQVDAFSGMTEKKVLFTHLGKVTQ